MSKTLVCIDMANLYYYLEKKGWTVDWAKFKTYLTSLYGEIIFIFYEGIRCAPHFMQKNPGASWSDYHKEVKDKIQYFRKLKEMGFIIETKYTNHIPAPFPKKPKNKCNFDVEITIDALSRIDSFERFILCSGDGDFLRLIDHLNLKQKKTLLIYPKDRTSDKLKHSTTEKSFSLGSIKEIVKEQVIPT
ncbi:MAG: NYN domain-containing protein [candidate division Zixibacteria bacterium]|nr:NYN domain-containing protein [candidate division Zixibacteria bacterium]